MKKELGIVVSLLLLLSVISCNESDSPTAEQASEPPASVTPVPVGIEITQRPRITQSPTTDPEKTESADLEATVGTPSATLAPTPIIYQVVEGDTISGIASKLDITVSAILSLNLALTPELLLVGQEIILPEVEIEPITTEPTSDPGTLDLEISSLAQYRTPLDDLWVLGVVENNSTQVFSDVRVAITLRDNSGAFESLAETSVPGGLILPGEIGPFGFLFIEPPEGELAVSVELQSASANVDPSIQPGDLAIDDAQATIQDNYVSYGGSISNTGPDPLEDIRLVTVFYDENSLISGYHSLVINEILLPAESVPFQFETIAMAPVKKVNSSAYGYRSGE